MVYREGALAHPVDFQLSYGNPIPGYQAPYEITAPAAGRIFAVILDILRQAYTAGLLRPYEAPRPYVVDDRKYKQAFGDHSTPLPEAIRQTAVWYRDHLT